MGLVVVLSGPKSSEQQARTALTSAGYTVAAHGDDHGLPPTVTGKKVRQATSFLTVHAAGDALDDVAACAAPFKYVVRLHHEKPPEPEPSEAQQLARALEDMRREIAELKAKVG